MFYLTTLSTFYLLCYGVAHRIMREKIYCWLLCLISSKVSFYVNHSSDKIVHTMTFVIPVVENDRNEKLLSWSTKRD